MKQLLLVFFALNGLCPTVMAQGSFVEVTLMTVDPVQYEKIEFDIALAVTFSNPYLQEEIKLDMILNAPSGKQIVLPCFFKSGGSVESHWGARFAAKEPGEYQYHFELTKLQSPSVTTEVQRVNVRASAKDGFLSSITNWSMIHDSGKPLRGIGENIAWEGRSWEAEEYTYEYFLTKLKANGGNYFRTWMGPWNLPLEWTRVVDTDRYNNENGYYHSGGIERMDALVELCDSLELYFMLAFEWHGALQTDGRWNINPYNTMNGGPASTPTEFFTNAEAKTRYKNKLRYVIARWGYSPSIAAWEFFNEVDNAVYNGTESNVAIPHNAVTEWHQQMAAYLKSIDPYDHLVTTSISHREINGLFNLAELDFVQKHYYRTTGNLPETINENRGKFNKPFVVGEFGFDWDWNNIHDANKTNLEYDYKRGLWYGLFSPTPILPLSWWWEFFDTHKTDQYIAAVRLIADKMAAKAPLSNFAPANISSTVLSLDAMALRAGDTYFVYVLNNSSSPTANKSVSLSVAEQKTFVLTEFDPENRAEINRGTISPSAGAVNLANLSFTSRESKIFILTPEGSSLGVQMPYGENIALPGRIETEHYDVGGEDISFNDLDEVNSGGVLRNDGVDLTEEGGRTFVTDIAFGEWIEYTIDVSTSGIYSFASAIRNNSTTEKLVRFQWDGEIIGSLQLDEASPEWDEYTFISPLLYAGQHTLRIVFSSGDIDLDYTDVELINVAPTVSLTVTNRDEYISSQPVTLSATAFDEDGSITSIRFEINGNVVEEVTSDPYAYEWTPSTGSYNLVAIAVDNTGLSVRSEVITIVVVPDQQQAPYPQNDTPHLVPGRIEAEYFDSGENGVAYFDLTPGNIKTSEREDTDVDLEVCTDTGSGFNLADIQAGEWVEYTVNVAETGFYKFTFRVATQMAGQSFDVLVNDTVAIKGISVPNTGGWQIWRDLESAPIKIFGGEKVIRLSFKSEFFNLNHFTIEETDPVTGIEPEEVNTFLYPNPSIDHFVLTVPVSAESLSLYTLQGKLLWQRVDVRPGVYQTPDLKKGIYQVLIIMKSGVKKNLKGVIK